MEWQWGQVLPQVSAVMVPWQLCLSQLPCWERGYPGHLSTAVHELGSFVIRCTSPGAWPVRDISVALKDPDYPLLEHPAERPQEQTRHWVSG